MSPGTEAYLAALETALISIVLPLAFLLTLYSWLFAIRAWRAPRHRQSDPSPKLPFAIALSLTVAGASITVLAWSVWYRSRIGPLPEWAYPLVATATVSISVVAYLPIIYIIAVEVSSWLRR
jgi:hypothetical protein